MPTLHLVRHGRPIVRPDRPASTWELSPDGEREIARLRDRRVLPAGALWVASSEPKALATARLLAGRGIRTSDELREMRRPADWLPSDRFRAAVRASLREPGMPARPEWETGADTVRRVRATLDSCVREAGPRDLVMVGHGTAWTLLIAELTDAPPDLEAWQRLRMPDHCALRIDRVPARLTCRWGAWAPEA